MKTLKLTLNIGVKDARRLNLEKTLEGQTVSVEKEVADELLRNGWAVEPTAKVEVPGVPGVPGAPAPAPADIPDFDAMTKEDLKAFADDYGVPNVTMAMSKDDMVRALKKATHGK